MGRLASPPQNSIFRGTTRIGSHCTHVVWVQLIRADRQCDVRGARDSYQVSLCSHWTGTNEQVTFSKLAKSIPVYIHVWSTSSCAGSARCKSYWLPKKLLGAVHQIFESDQRSTSPCSTRFLLSKLQSKSKHKNILGCSATFFKFWLEQR